MPSPRHAQPSAFRRVLDNRPRHAVSASVLAAAMTLPVLAAAPSSAAPVPAPTSPIVVPMDTPSTTQYARTNVNVRSGAGTGHSIVGSKAKGTKVTGTWTSSGWLKIGSNQYISGSVLTSTPPSSNTVTRYARTNVNVRSGAGTGYSIVGSKTKGTKLTGTLTSGGWLKIGSSQYISGTVLTSTPPSSNTVTRYARTNVNVRAGASTSHAIVDRETQGTKLTGTLTSNGWLKTGSSRYVSGAVLSTTHPGDGGGNDGLTGDAILAEGRKYFGIMYRSGGASPSTGFDCSGYTQYVFKQLGVTLPRTTTGQKAATTRVSNPKPGDLVFWGSTPYHVAIYAGDGYIYDSGKPGLPVQKRKMFSGVSSYGRVG
ncbi:NlpC/P60 family protein [Ornithinimicrobium sp. F0845]|uniref:C40 family peptidase n=1 Tax=Ornithinimicrobium sp. F0845 TaxID=2926412 RepID=UPI001FF2022B|nr:NlpC/P60 family protein [Ornithinimicrobium sp. F0845]MCK0112897.1 NlpC/P60 family protein [Ornithinimicrobium sp. F0845]